MNENLKPVLIAGAGPTGMMAAIELSRFNIPVRLIEKKAEPDTASRAIGVQARTLELLDQRRLASSLAKLGNPGLAFSLHGDGEADLAARVRTDQQQIQLFAVCLSSRDSVPDRQVLPPHVFAGVTNNMAIAQDEIFGPIGASSRSRTKRRRRTWLIRPNTVCRLQCSRGTGSAV